MWNVELRGKKSKDKAYSLLIQKSKGSSAFNEQKLTNVASEYRLQLIFPYPGYSAFLLEPPQVLSSSLGFMCITRTCRLLVLSGFGCCAFHRLFFSACCLFFFVCSFEFSFCFLLYLWLLCFICSFYGLI